MDTADKRLEECIRLPGQSGVLFTVKNVSYHTLFKIFNVKKGKEDRGDWESVRKGEGMRRNSDGDTKYKFTQFKHIVLNLHGTVNWCYRKLRYSCYRKQSFYVGVNRRTVQVCQCNGIILLI
jgi:hypothetical protein